MLVTGDWLAEHLADPDLVVVDMRWRGDGSGRALWEASRIPGAVHVDWATDIVDPDGEFAFMLAPPAQFAEAMERAGIDDDSVVVAYANERNMMDVLAAIVFGLFGYFLRRHGYPLISLVIGLILGRLAEGSFHQALMISDYDYSVFLLRPLSAAILAACAVLVLWPGVKRRLGRGGAEVT